MVSKKKRKARDLLNRLEQIVTEPMPGLPTPEKAARMDASLLDEAPPEEAPAPTKARTKTSS